MVAPRQIATEYRVFFPQTARWDGLGKIRFDWTNERPKAHVLTIGRAHGERNWPINDGDFQQPSRMTRNACHQRFRWGLSLRQSAQCWVWVGLGRTLSTSLRDEVDCCPCFECPPVRRLNRNAAASASNSRFRMAMGRGRGSQNKQIFRLGVRYGLTPRKKLGGQAAATTAGFGDGFASMMWSSKPQNYSDGISSLMSVEILEQPELNRGALRDPIMAWKLQRLRDPSSGTSPRFTSTPRSWQSGARERRSGRKLRMTGRRRQLLCKSARQ